MYVQETCWPLGSLMSRAERLDVDLREGRPFWRASTADSVSLKLVTDLSHQFFSRSGTHGAAPSSCAIAAERIRRCSPPFRTDMLHIHVCFICRPTMQCIEVLCSAELTAILWQFLLSRPLGLGWPVDGVSF